MNEVIVPVAIYPISAHESVSRGNQKFGEEQYLTKRESLICKSTTYDHSSRKPTSFVVGICQFRDMFCMELRIQRAEGQSNAWQ